MTETAIATPAASNAAIVNPAKVKRDVLRDMLEKSRASMAAVVPKHVTPERLIKVALVAANRTPLLLQCDPLTVVRCVMEAAQLGLDCGGVLGSAYLVPFKNMKSNKMECQLIVGYRGLIDLARRSGEIETIEAHVVRKNDSFEIAFGLQPVLKHVPCLDPEKEPGDLILVYAIARMKDGGWQCEVMTKKEVDKIRNRSRASSSGPWVSDYDEMARKTVVRRLAKYLPLSPELMEHVAKEDKFDSTASLELLSSDATLDVPAEDLTSLPEIPAEPEPEKPVSKASRLADQLKKALAI